MRVNGEEVDTVPAAGQCLRTFVRSLGWHGVRLGALGVKAFAEARYHRVSVASGTVQYVPVTIGVMF